MRIQSDRQTEADITYWQSRVTSLELIVCELMACNERLRSDLHRAPANLRPEY